MTSVVLLSRSPPPPPPDNFRYTCDICGKKYKYYSCFQEHRDLHAVDGESGPSLLGVTSEKEPSSGALPRGDGSLLQDSGGGNVPAYPRSLLWLIQMKLLLHFFIFLEVKMSRMLKLGLVPFYSFMSSVCML